MADIVRPMQAMDIDRVYELERTCFRTPWSRQSLKDELTNSIAHYLVFERDKRVIAYAGMWIIYDEAHITNVAVDPDFRRQGIAKRVMLCMMRTLKLRVLGSLYQRSCINTSSAGCPPAHFCMAR